MLVMAAALVAGVGVGVLSGMLGIGGGSMMVPLFRLAFGLPALQATATSLFAIIPTSFAGLVEHLRTHTCLVPLGIAAGLTGALLSPVGAELATASPPWAVMLATAAVIVCSSVAMLRRGLAEPKEGSARPSKTARRQESAADVGHAELAGSAGAAKPEDSDGAADGNTTVSGQQRPWSGRALSRGQIAAGAGIGLAAGLAAGYVGLGGGFLMVPLFVSLVGASMKEASATSLLAICILALPGVTRHLMLGNVAVVAGLAMAAGTVPGAVVGARLASHVPDRTLKLFFGVFLIVVALFLVFNEFVLA